MQIRKRCEICDSDRCAFFNIGSKRVCAGCLDEYSSVFDGWHEISSTNTAKIHATVIRSFAHIRKWNEVLFGKAEDHAEERDL